MRAIMMISPASVLRIATTSLEILLIGLAGAWGTMALWYQAPGKVRKISCIIAWIGFCAAVLVGLWRDFTLPSLTCFAAAFGALWIWWQRIRPTNDRNWADDVARITSGSIDGNRITLRDVRNFDWRADDDYVQRWETRTYALERLNSVDMVLSYWNGWAIAHMLICFGFDDGHYVAFSVEVRRQKNRSYSEIGGFFKRDGLSIIAADERDVIRVRTNVRGEDDYLYRLRMPLSAMRSLFLGYVEQANKLIAAPRFYNTITVNCTMLAYHMMKRIIGHLPWSYRVLFNGYLPAYVYGVGGLDQRFTLAQLRAFGRITERARQSDRSATFSEDIRRGIPPLEPSQLPPD